MRPRRPLTPPFSEPDPSRDREESEPESPAAGEEGLFARKSLFEGQAATGILGELAEFENADRLPIDASPSFREGLRRRLWKLMREKCILFLLFFGLN